MSNKWTPTTFKGQPARLYPDGSVRNERGHMLTRLPGATEGALAKRAKVRLVGGLDAVTGQPVPSIGTLLGEVEAEEATDQERTAQAGLIKAAKVNGEANTVEEAWGVLVEKRALSAMGSGRGATQDARFVGEATGLMRKESSSGGGGTVVVQVVVGAGLTDRYSEQQGGDVIDVTPSPAAGGEDKAA